MQQQHAGVAGGEAGVPEAFSRRGRPAAGGERGREQLWRMTGASAAQTAPSTPNWRVLQIAVKQQPTSPAFRVATCSNIGTHTVTTIFLTLTAGWPAHSNEPQCPTTDGCRVCWAVVAVAGAVPCVCLRAHRWQQAAADAGAGQLQRARARQAARAGAAGCAGRAPGCRERRPPAARAQRPGAAQTAHATRCAWRA
jgi:hypothetical protein